MLLLHYILRVIDLCVESHGWTRYVVFERSLVYLYSSLFWSIDKTELSELTVSIGGLDQTLLGTGTGGWEERTISKATCHPQYNSMTEENDICILKLNKPSTKTV